jgi:F-type H+-transporting ATPase subunit epsilon
MAHPAFELQILTPEGHVFSGEAEFISTRTETGSIGIYARHEPVLALLVPAELHVTLAGGEEKVYAQGEGYVQVSPDKVMLLVEEALERSELDLDELNANLADAEARLEGADAGSEAEARAKRDIRRASAFLSVAA